MKKCCLSAVVFNHTYRMETLKYSDSCLALAVALDLEGMVKMSKYNFGHAASMRSLDREPDFVPHESGPSGAGHGPVIGDSIAGLFSRVVRRAHWFFGGLLEWNELAHQRHQLASLEDHVLRDIGIEREAARREASRPFWDIERRLVR